MVSLNCTGIYQDGCHAFKKVSPNVELEESGIKEDKEFSESCQYSEVYSYIFKVFICICFFQQNLVNFLEVSIDYLLHAERYETIGEISKLIIPFYEKKREFKVNKTKFILLFHWL